jgi:hypothetical protein
MAEKGVIDESECNALKEVMIMADVSPYAQQCCLLEKEHLVEKLRKCDLCSESYEEFHQCYRDVAKESGRRARSCITA